MKVPEAQASYSSLLCSLFSLKLFTSFCLSEDKYRAPHLAGRARRGEPGVVLSYPDLSSVCTCSPPLWGLLFLGLRLLFLFPKWPLTTTTTAHGTLQ